MSPYQILLIKINTSKSDVKRSLFPWYDPERIDIEQNSAFVEDLRCREVRVHAISYNDERSLATAFLLRVDLLSTDRVALALKIRQETETWTSLASTR